jgi:hypothetical protein
MLRRGRLRIPNHLVAQAVLELPPSVDEYLSGGRTQAMRTNVGHAERLGMRCEQLRTEFERRAVADASFFTDSWRREQLLSDPERTCWIVLDSHNEPIGLATLSVDAEAAILWCLVGNGSPERWLLHARIVGTLIEAGVRLLLVDSPSALCLQPGLQYFQRLLGYRVSHLSLSG